MNTQQQSFRQGVSGLLALILMQWAHLRSRNFKAAVSRSGPKIELPAAVRTMDNHPMVAEASECGSEEGEGEENDIRLCFRSRWL